MPVSSFAGLSGTPVAEATWQTFMTGVAGGVIGGGTAIVPTMDQVQRMVVTTVIDGQSFDLAQSAAASGAAVGTFVTATPAAIAKPAACSNVNGYTTYTSVIVTPTAILVGDRFKTANTCSSTIVVAGTCQWDTTSSTCVSSASRFDVPRPHCIHNDTLS